MISQRNYKADFCTPQEGIQTGRRYAPIGKIFLLPLIVLFPMFLGIDGVMYAGPVADLAAALLAVFFSVRELKLMRKLEHGSSSIAAKSNASFQ